jgi:hypothetical protein
MPEPERESPVERRIARSFESDEWYPIESSLPMDPRTRDYVRIRGRSYRCEELGPEWVLRHFPAQPG